MFRNRHRQGFRVADDKFDVVIIDDATQQAMVWQYKDWKEFLVAAMDCEVEKLVWFPVGQIATRCDEPDDKQ